MKNKSKKLSMLDFGILCIKTDKLTVDFNVCDLKVIILSIC